MADQDQFDGRNPVSGYTLFHGKDGKSYYLKGENLSDEDITSRVQKLRGTSQSGGIDVGELQQRTLGQARATAAAPITSAITEGENSQFNLDYKGPTPAEQISGSLSKYIAGKDVSALRSGNPKDVAGSVPRMAKSAIDLGRSATTPGNMALATGIAAAQTNPFTAIPVDAALIAHGGFNALTSAPEALQGNPDALENALLSSSEAVGGVAGIGAQRAPIARRLYTEKADLKPGVTRGAQVVGGLMGSGAGAVAGHGFGPYGTAAGAATGGTVGAAVGPAVLGKMFPPPPVYPSAYGGAFAPEAAEFYGKRGAEINAANNIAAKFLKERAKTAAASETGPPQPSTDEFYANEAKTRMALLKQAAERGDTSVSNPFAKRPEAPQGIITDPSAGTGATPVSEGRPASWSQEDLNRLALQGNRSAIQQFVNRAKQLLPNTRYVAGDAYYPNAEYNPRGPKTIFSPEGTPIQGGQMTPKQVEQQFGLEYRGNPIKGAEFGNLHDFKAPDGGSFYLDASKGQLTPEFIEAKLKQRAQEINPANLDPLAASKANQ